MTPINQAYASALTGKTILITGGTGSFGRAMTERLLKTDIANLIIFSRDEEKQERFRQDFNDPRVRTIVGDIRDREKVFQSVRNVDMVFHAAALKQVPSCEFFPMEAVKTNVMGAHNIVEACINEGVEKLVCLSTDKAAYPVNAMGMTKALMEKIVTAAAREHRHSNTTVCCVRYGNVLYSRGSVIPLFVRQIQEGKDITVTDPTMTRFVLSLEEATELVLYAFANAGSGDILIKKARSFTIGDLADALKDAFKADNAVKVIGVRHGEKPFETLATREELARSEDCGDFFKIKLDARDLDYENYFSEGFTNTLPAEDYHSSNVELLNREGIAELLKELPEIRDALA